MSKRRFRIDGGRYGGELTIGSVDSVFVEYFLKNGDESSLIDTILSYDWDDKEMGDKKAPRMKNFYSWTECTDFEHINDVFSDQEFTVSEVPGDGSDDYFYDKNAIIIKNNVFLIREAYFEELTLVDIKSENTDFNKKDWIPVLSFLASEKGSLGSWFLETDGDNFDPNKLSCTTISSNLSTIVDRVFYGKSILAKDYDSSSTVGSSYSAKVGYLNTNQYDKFETITENSSCWSWYDDEFKNG